MDHLLFQKTLLIAHQRSEIAESDILPRGEKATMTLLLVLRRSLIATSCAGCLAPEHMGLSITDSCWCDLLIGRLPRGLKVSHSNEWW